MTAAVADKIDIARILIERMDGFFARARVSTIAAANSVLEAWAPEAPEEGEARCDVRIVFEDGLQCRSSIGLTRSHKRISLSRYIRQQIRAAEQRGGKPTHDAITITSAKRSQPSPMALLDQYDI
ncbi:hypothetical protein SAMN06265795_104255 [Noviherbaspirillum humi]|uniref:Uncharacterized protein n=2 Tax=Noviherbaspirillum humi TaxID=1688639 RepID=A0A239G654_9BURK|nr:hypothetical protein SAMN06265795_104255 [Noviherbaspirillum humi]